MVNKLIPYCKETNCILPNTLTTKHPDTVTVNTFIPFLTERQTERQTKHSKIYVLHFLFKILNIKNQDEHINVQTNQHVLFSHVYHEQRKKLGLLMK